MTPPPPQETDDEAAPGCFASPADPDRARFIVLSHPYAEDGSNSDRYGVYRLDTDGEISPVGHHFDMRRATEGRITFTPDGSIGFVVQGDGSIGIFGLDADGLPHVIDPGFKDGFYAGGLVLDAHRRRLLVTDPNWEENGGGVSIFDLDCEGALTFVSKTPTRLARGLALLEPRPGKAILAAKGYDGPPDGNDLRLIDLSDEPVLLDSIQVFADGDAIVSALAVSPDGAFALVGDNSFFADTPNRVGVAAIEGDRLVPVQSLAPIEDPAAIVFSPFGDAALVASGFGNALFRIVHDPESASAPFVLEGEIDYAGPRPSIPVSAVGIERGTMLGRVLVAEYMSVRQLQFMGDGEILDLGAGWSGEGFTDMVGAIGVQP